MTILTNLPAADAAAAPQDTNAATTEVVDQSLEQSSGEGEVELSPVEQEAMSRGWRPKEEWEGDPAEWTDAQNFVKHGQLMDRISSQSRKMKQMSEALLLVKKQYDDIETKAYNKAKADLLAEKKLALSMGDTDRVVDIDEQLKEVEASGPNVIDLEIDETDEGTDEPVVNTAIRDYYQNNWLPNNKWYTTNESMKTMADNLGARFSQANPGATPQQIFGHVDAQLRKDFPDFFKNRRQTAQAVGMGGPGRNTGGKSTYKLSPDEEKIGRGYVAAGAFKDLAEYAASLAEVHRKYS